MQKEKMNHEIKYGFTKYLPKKIREKENLEGSIYNRMVIGEMAHKTEFIDNLEKAGYDVILDDKIDLHLERNGLGGYVHTKGEKIFYIEDIKRIIKKMIIDKFENKSVCEYLHSIGKIKPELEKKEKMEKEKIITIGYRKFRIYVEDLVKFHKLNKNKELVYLENSDEVDTSICPVTTKEVYKTFFENLEVELVKYISENFDDEFDSKMFDEHLYENTCFFCELNVEKYSHLKSFNVKIHEIICLNDKFIKMKCQKCLNAVKILEDEFFDDFRTEYLGELMKKLNITEFENEKGWFLKHNGFEFEVIDCDHIKFEGEILQSKDTCSKLIESRGHEKEFMSLIEDESEMKSILERSKSAAQVNIYLEYYDNLNKEYFNHLYEIIEKHGLKVIKGHGIIKVVSKDNNWFFAGDENNLFGMGFVHSKVIKNKRVELVKNFKNIGVKD
jgi:hypothetical protein